MMSMRRNARRAYIFAHSLVSFSASLRSSAICRLSLHRRPKKKEAKNYSKRIHFLFTIESREKSIILLCLSCVNRRKKNIFFPHLFARCQLHILSIAIFIFVMYSLSHTHVRAHANNILFFFILFHSLCSTLITHPIRSICN